MNETQYTGEALTMSSYNKQHSLEHGEDERSYDPLEKYFDRYTLTLIVAGLCNLHLQQTI